MGPRQGRHLGRLIKAFSLGSIKRDRESGASWQQEYDRESPQHSDIDPCVELYIDMPKSGASGDKDTSIYLDRSRSRGSAAPVGKAASNRCGFDSLERRHRRGHA